VVASYTTPVKLMEPQDRFELSSTPYQSVILPLKYKGKLT
jgi:hypothetical protein